MTTTTATTTSRKRGRAAKPIPEHAPPIVHLVAAIMAKERVSRTELARRMIVSPEVVSSFLLRHESVTPTNADHAGFKFGIKALAAMGYGLVISAEKLEGDQ